MNLDQQTSLLTMLDRIVPTYQPVSIVPTSIEARNFPPVDFLAKSLKNWDASEATQTIELMAIANSHSENFVHCLNSCKVELLDRTPSVLAHGKSILELALPLITKEDRLSLILYHSKGHRCNYPYWTIAALGRQTPIDEWEILVQYRPGIAQQM